jgi:tripartite-type tricarboxylate transporter receptor subunit TctC
MQTLSCTMRGIVLALLAVLLASGPLLAEPWPQRPVRLILPLPPGGATDLAARLFAERLTERWRQPVFVENRQGADGIPGITAFLAARDRHTLLFSFAGPITINPLIHEKLPYDPQHDLVPISAAAENFFAIAVSPGLNVRSMRELLTVARAAPGKLNWAATPGLPHYIVLALQKSAALDMTEIGYRDFGPAFHDLAAGRIHLVATGLALHLPHVKAGAARLLLVTSRARSPLFPGVPTANEAGFPELAFEGVVGFYGWRGIEPDLKERIATDIRSAGADPVIAARLEGLGTIVRTGTPAEFATAIEEQRVKIAALARREPALRP